LIPLPPLSPLIRQFKIRCSHFARRSAQPFDFKPEQDRESWIR